MTDETRYDELDLMDIILILKKYWKLIISLTILTMLIIGSITAFFIQPKYTSQVVFEICNLPESELENTYLMRKINNPDYHLELIRTSLFLEKVLTEAGMDADPAIIPQLAGSIQIQKKQDLVFTLKVTWSDPEVAYKLVQNIFESHQANIIESIREQDNSKRDILLAQLEKKRVELEEAENQLVLYEKENGITALIHQVLVADDYKGRHGQDLSDVLKKYRLLQWKRDAVYQDFLEISRLLTALDINQALVQSVAFRIINSPVVPSAKSSPSLQLNLAVAGFLGLFIGVMLAFFLEYLQNYRRDHAASSQCE